MDDGHRYTDNQIALIESRLKKEYSQALREMQEKSKKVLERFEENDKIMVQKLHANKITLKEYQEWRRKAILRTEQVDGLIKDLSTRLVNTDKIAADIINDKIPKVYAENANYATYDIEHQSRINTNFTLVNQDTVKHLIKGDRDLLRIADVDIIKDHKWNESHIRSAITQGILQGESPQKVAKRLQKVTDMDRRAAVRNARTIMTGVQNAGRMDSIKRAKGLGLAVKKRWIATLDNVTRDSHVDLDGEIREVDEPFSNGLDFPGASGPPEEVYNCRCDVRPYYDKYATDTSDLSLRNTDKFGDMSYKEWKDAHKEGARKIREKQETKVKIANTLVEPQRPRKADFMGNEDAFQQARTEYREAKAKYNEDKKALVNEWMNAERQYNTSDDLRAWAEKQNVVLMNNVENLVDPKLINDICTTLDEMFEKYPEVKQRFDAMSYFGLDIEPKTMDYFMEANGGLRLGHTFTSAEMTYNDVIDMQASGFLTRATGDLAAQVRHEYGHNMDSVLRQKFSTLDSDYSWKQSGKLDRRNEARQQYDKELIEITLKHGSEYSRTNTLEAFAEGFSEYTSNPNSEYGRAFGEFFERWYNANPIE